MDDTQFGVHNKRGDFTPNAPREIAPFWAWPPQPLKVLKWLPGLLWPWNLIHLTTALLWWYLKRMPWALRLYKRHSK
ncbi:MAG: hypothetical protein RI959_1871, partial [Pseudomonadota bacterium]